MVFQTAAPWHASGCPVAMDTLLQDLRYALRSFSKAPGFTALALLTFAIGIGVNASVFGFVNALLLKPAPVVRDPGSLVSVFTSDFSSGPYGASSYPDYLSMKAGAPALPRLAAFSEGSAVMRIDEQVERIRTTAVSGEFFDLLGVQPVAGRAIGPGGHAAGCAPGRRDRLQPVATRFRRCAVRAWASRSALTADR